VQIDLDPSSTGVLAPRGGVAPAHAGEVCAALQAADHLRLAGVMAVAPREGDPAAAFARLADLVGRLRSSYPSLGGPQAIISAGMSDDLEAAVAHGATHLRVGRALLGSRPPLR
jgi:hypothetical protein